VSWELLIGSYSRHVIIGARRCSYRGDGGYVPIGFHEHWPRELLAMNDCIFCRIVKGELKADKVWENEQILAFRDVNPQAPTHVLVIPKLHSPGLSSAVEKDRELLGRLLLAAAEVARQEGVGESFRSVINTGSEAGQSVFHLHLHVLGGRSLNWPPG